MERDVREALARIIQLDDTADLGRLCDGCEIDGANRFGAATQSSDLKNALNAGRRALTVSPPAGGEVALREAAAKIAEAEPRCTIMSGCYQTMLSVRQDIAKRIRALPLSAVLGEGDGSAAGAAPFAGRQSLPAALQDWLADIEEFLTDQHDIRDGAGGQQLPNKAMALSTALKEALGERP